jgi:hypothetical protein
MKNMTPLLIGALALFVASAVPMPPPPFPVEDSDCTEDSRGCGKRNDACKLLGGQCEPGSIGDPDGDGCACVIPT